MAKMPAARLWAALFFFMLLCLALNSQVSISILAHNRDLQNFVFQFAIVEVVVTSIQDGFRSIIKKRLFCHEMLVLVICVVSFLCGLPNVTEVSKKKIIYSESLKTDISKFLGKLIF